ncbi:thiol-disulfide oxidoreductase ResA [Halobacillus locisalis]|uniref:Thiol-disulfide oxidoreductase ResA n=1 Tax=Halobacillus locisalis TaxID=220753 RepID=A0A838CQB5_9BACI|nr:thiol-disulfide oxidoreductase ResA [Halobacillus locisalis]MBA2173826.1 thiol-disulfide oxidoreductase ResA [Halobacillus locisalis]
MKESTLKKKQKRLIFRSAMLLVMAGLVVFAVVSSLGGEDAVIAKGEKAPNFQLKKFGTDETVDLRDLEGKGVMLNFWATYCEPCKDEMPYMEELYDKYENQGVEILAINLDSTDIVVERFLQEYGLTFPILRDESGQVMDLYQIGPIPTSIFINPEGEIVEQVRGALTLSKLDGYLQQITPE